MSTTRSSGVIPFTTRGFRTTTTSYVDVPACLLHMTDKEVAELRKLVSAEAARRRMKKAKEKPNES